MFLEHWVFRNVGGDIADYCLHDIPLPFIREQLRREEGSGIYIHDSGVISGREGRYLFVVVGRQWQRTMIYL